jgi:hypothetical protein
MKYKRLRIALGVLTGFIALKAVGGGLAVLTGAEGSRFPLEWLRGSPFKDYTVPALELMIAVGGSSLVACVTVVTSRKVGGLTSMLAGLFLMGHIAAEVLILKQVHPGPTVTEVVYFGLGLIIFLLAAFLWGAEHRPPRDTIS